MVLLMIVLEAVDGHGHERISEAVGHGCHRAHHGPVARKRDVTEWMTVPCCFTTKVTGISPGVTREDGKARMKRMLRSLTRGTSEMSPSSVSFASGC
jgi:hypothetical protein